MIFPLKIMLVFRAATVVAEICMNRQNFIRESRAKRSWILCILKYLESHSPVVVFLPRQFFLSGKLANKRNDKEIMNTSYILTLRAEYMPYPLEAMHQSVGPLVLQLATNAKIAYVAITPTKSDQFAWFALIYHVKTTFSMNTLFSLEKGKHRKNPYDLNM